MSDSYLGEIRMFAGNFAPTGWAFCDGQLLQISEFDALFILLGTTYGGDGQSTFALPNLQGRVPMHAGSVGGFNFTLAEWGGVEEVTLNHTQIPSHTHAMVASTERGSGAYTNLNGYPAASVGAGSGIYGLTDGGTQAMALNAMGSAGGSQPHTNMAPYTCINFIISLYGMFPQPQN
ncbi:phage tail protein [Pseudoduganella sp.]|uniref:phage tail protein n=1 Tax=Pseudoduganella sp. TaxID=1880898 RepID=UPI0035AF664A